MTLDEWLRAASEDAERRRRPELVPRLADLAAATRRLRGAVWNREAVPSGPAEAQTPRTADGSSRRNREAVPSGPAETRAPETTDGASRRNRESVPPPGPTEEP